MEIKHQRTVARISFLSEEGKRESVKISRFGWVLCRNFKRLSPWEFVGLFFVRDGDPFITLVDGDKLRVYYGGDPSQKSVQAHAILENHCTYYGHSAAPVPAKPLALPPEYPWGSD